MANDDDDDDDDTDDRIDLQVFDPERLKAFNVICKRNKTTISNYKQLIWHLN